MTVINRRPADDQQSNHDTTHGYHNNVIKFNLRNQGSCVWKYSHERRSICLLCHWDTLYRVAFKVQKWWKQCLLLNTLVTCTNWWVFGGLRPRAINLRFLDFQPSAGSDHPFSDYFDRTPFTFLKQPCLLYYELLTSCWECRWEKCFKKGFLSLCRRDLHCVRPEASIDKIIL